jgi:hypothetical protein
VLSREEVEKTAAEILAAHGIGEDRSADVKDLRNLPRNCWGILPGTSHMAAVLPK